jgi:hypothetical protein
MLEYWVGFDVNLDDKILKIWKFQTIEKKNSDPAGIRDISKILDSTDRYFFP